MNECEENHSIVYHSIGALLTVSVHHPHLAPTCMHSPQDNALALMHSLPSAENTRAKDTSHHALQSHEISVQRSNEE